MFLIFFDKKKIVSYFENNYLVCVVNINMNDQRQLNLELTPNPFRALF